MNEDALRPRGDITISRAEYDALRSEAQAARVLRVRVATLIDLLPSVEVYGRGRLNSKRIDCEIHGFTLKNAAMRCINHDDVIEKIDRLVLLWK